MRHSSLWREVGLNLATGTTRAAQYLLAFVLVVGVLCASELVTVSQLISRAEAFRAAGAATLTLEATGIVDGGACDALASVGGVGAAVALRHATNDLTATRLPDSSIPTFEVSAGLGSFSALPVTGASDGVTISRDLATTLGLRVGSLLQLTTGDLTVTGIMDYPDDGRRPGFGYGIFVPSDLRKPFDECWIDTWPQRDSLAGLLYSTLLPNPNAVDAPAPRVSQLNGSLGVRFTGATDFSQRVSRYAPLAAILVGLALGMLSVRSRRLELASAQHAGTARGTQLVQVLVETAAWALGASLVVACGITVAVVAGDAAAGPLAARVLALAVPGVLVGAALAAITTRERHLFRYFKDR